MSVFVGKAEVARTSPNCRERPNDDITDANDKWRFAVVEGLFQPLRLRVLNDRFLRKRQPCAFTTFTLMRMGKRTFGTSTLICPKQVLTALRLKGYPLQEFISEPRQPIGFSIGTRQRGASTSSTWMRQTKLRLVMVKLAS